MKRFIKFLVFTALFASFSACDDVKDKAMKWGETEFYSSSFLQDYEPVIMTKTLNFALNEDGSDLKDAEFEFELYEKTSNGETEKATGIILHKNGAPCPNNVLTIKGGEGKIVVGIEFTANAAEGNHELSLKLKSLNRLDRVNYDASLGDWFYASKTNIMNPADKMAIWGTIIFIAICFTWYLISRFIFWSSTAFSRVTITYNNGCESTIKMRGGYKLVCTSNTKSKDSLFEKIFKGSRRFEYNDFWEYPINISTGSRRNNVSITGAKRYSINGDKVRRSPIEIINENGDKVTIQTT